jgi:four helix bundle protein
MKVYRLSMFAGAIGWRDVTKLMSDRRTIASADQLFRALGSIGANLAEGYSRNSGNDRARYYEYALGSARESRHWYNHAADVLPAEVLEHRLDLLSEITKMLIAIVPIQRGKTIREEAPIYEVDNGVHEEVPYAE